MSERISTVLKAKGSNRGTTAVFHFDASSHSVHVYATEVDAPMTNVDDFYVWDGVENVLLWLDRFARENNLDIENHLGARLTD